MIFIKLDCGRTVYLSNFHYTRTYGGLLDGQPDKRLHSRILEDARGDGTQGKHLIPPEVDESDPDHPRLPSTQLTAHLTCLDPIDENYMASDLTVVWFMNDETFEARPVADVIAESVRGIDWNLLARDFDW
jgi:hypothetical protein